MSSCQNRYSRYDASNGATSRWSDGWIAPAPTGYYGHHYPARHLHHHDTERSRHAHFDGERATARSRSSRRGRGEERAQDSSRRGKAPAQSFSAQVVPVPPRTPRQRDGVEGSGHDREISRDAFRGAAPHGGVLRSNSRPPLRGPRFSDSSSIHDRDQPEPKKLATLAAGLCVCPKSSSLSPLGKKCGDHTSSSRSPEVAEEAGGRGGAGSIDPKEEIRTTHSSPFSPRANLTAHLKLERDQSAGMPNEAPGGVAQGQEKGVAFAVVPTNTALRAVEYSVLNAPGGKSATSFALGYPDEPQHLHQPGASPVQSSLHRSVPMSIPSSPISSPGFHPGAGDVSSSHLDEATGNRTPGLVDIGRKPNAVGGDEFTQVAQLRMNGGPTGRAAEVVPHFAAAPHPAPVVPLVSTSTKVPQPGAPMFAPPLVPTAPRARLPPGGFVRNSDLPYIRSASQSQPQLGARPAAPPQPQVSTHAGDGLAPVLLNQVEKDGTGGGLCSAEPKMKSDLCAAARTESGNSSAAEQAVDPGNRDGCPGQQQVEQDKDNYSAALEQHKVETGGSSPRPRSPEEDETMTKLQLDAKEEDLLLEGLMHEGCYLTSDEILDQMEQMPALPPPTSPGKKDVEQEQAGQRGQRQSAADESKESDVAVPAWEITCKEKLAQARAKVRAYHERMSKSKTKAAEHERTARGAAAADDGGDHPMPEDGSKPEPTSVTSALANSPSPPPGAALAVRPLVSGARDEGEPEAEAAALPGVAQDRLGHDQEHAAPVGDVQVRDPCHDPTERSGAGGASHDAAGGVPDLDPNSDEEGGNPFFKEWNYWPATSEELAEVWRKCRAGVPLASMREASLHDRIWFSEQAEELQARLTKEQGPLAVKREAAGIAVQEEVTSEPAAQPVQKCARASTGPQEQVAALETGGKAKASDSLPDEAGNAGGGSPAERTGARIDTRSDDANPDSEAVDSEGAGTGDDVVRCSRHCPALGDDGSLRERDNGDCSANVLAQSRSTSTTKSSSMAAIVEQIGCSGVGVEDGGDPSPGLVEAGGAAAAELEPGAENRREKIRPEAAPSPDVELRKDLPFTSASLPGFEDHESKMDVKLSTEPEPSMSGSGKEVDLDQTTAPAILQEEMDFGAAASELQAAGERDLELALRSAAPLTAAAPGATGLLLHGDSSPPAASRFEKFGKETTDGKTLAGGALPREQVPATAGEGLGEALVMSGRKDEVLSDHLEGGQDYTKPEAVGRLYSPEPDKMEQVSQIDRAAAAAARTSSSKNAPASAPCASTGKEVVGAPAGAAVRAAAVLFDSAAAGGASTSNTTKLTREELEAMKKTELLQMCRKRGVLYYDPARKKLKLKKEIVDQLLAAGVSKHESSGARAPGEGETLEKNKASNDDGQGAGLALAPPESRSKSSSPALAEAAGSGGKEAGAGPLKNAVAIKQEQLGFVSEMGHDAEVCSPPCPEQPDNLRQAPAFACSNSAQKQDGEAGANAKTAVAVKHEQTPSSPLTRQTSSGERAAQGKAAGSGERSELARHHPQPEVGVKKVKEEQRADGNSTRSASAVGLGSSCFVSAVAAVKSKAAPKKLTAKQLRKNLTTKKAPPAEEVRREPSAAGCAPQMLSKADLPSEDVAEPKNADSSPAPCPSSLVKGTRAPCLPAVEVKREQPSSGSPVLLTDVLGAQHHEHVHENDDKAAPQPLTRRRAAHSPSHKGGDESSPASGSSVVHRAKRPKIGAPASYVAALSVAPASPSASSGAAVGKTSVPTPPRVKIDPVEQLPKADLARPGDHDTADAVPASSAAAPKAIKTENVVESTPVDAPQPPVSSDKVLPAARRTLFASKEELKAFLCQEKYRGFTEDARKKALKKVEQDPRYRPPDDGLATVEKLFEEHLFRRRSSDVNLPGSDSHRRPSVSASCASVRRPSLGARTPGCAAASSASSSAAAAPANGTTSSCGDEGDLQTCLKNWQNTLDKLWEERNKNSKRGATSATSSGTTGSGAGSGRPGGKLSENESRELVQAALFRIIEKFTAAVSIRIFVAQLSKNARSFWEASGSKWVKYKLHPKVLVDLGKPEKSVDKNAKGSAASPANEDKRVARKFMRYLQWCLHPDKNPEFPRRATTVFQKFQKAMRLDESEEGN